ATANYFFRTALQVAVRVFVVLPITPDPHRVFGVGSIHATSLPTTLKHHHFSLRLVAAWLQRGFPGDRNYKLRVGTCTQLLDDSLRKPQGTPNINRAQLAAMTPHPALRFFQPERGVRDSEQCAQGRHPGNNSCCRASRSAFPKNLCSRCRTLPVARSPLMYLS